MGKHIIIDYLYQIYIIASKYEFDLYLLVQNILMILTQV